MGENSFSLRAQLGANCLKNMGWTCYGKSCFVSNYCCFILVLNIYEWLGSEIPNAVQNLFTLNWSKTLHSNNIIFKLSIHFCGVFTVCTLPPFVFILSSTHSIYFPFLLLAIVFIYKPFSWVYKVDIRIPFISIQCFRIFIAIGFPLQF